MKLVDHFQYGLDSPICLTWELTYACNLACVHCLSSSGRRDPRELTTDECKAVIDELQRMQVFYVNVGGGEPTVRPDFWELLDYAIGHDVGRQVLHQRHQAGQAPRRPVGGDRLRRRPDLAGRRDGGGQRRASGGPARTTPRCGRWRTCAEAGFARPKICVVMTRQNVDQLDEFKAIADKFGAQLRITRLRPSGRGADVWDELHPLPRPATRAVRLAGRPGRGGADRGLVLPPLGLWQALPGLNLCGAGRVVCLIDPVGDVYACPFAIHENFLAGNVRAPGGFAGVWRDSELFADLRRPQTGGACSSCSFFDSCQGGCMAAKFFTGLPLDGPDPECVRGFGEQALAARAATTVIPRSEVDHSRSTPGNSRTPKGPVPLTLSARRPATKPDRACDESPLAGFAVPVAGP